MFAFRTRAERAEVAFTDRHGGYSREAWESLNLGTSSGDDPATVERNLRTVADAFGGPIVRMSQFHGNDVAVVGPDDTETVPRADALVTTAEGLTLLVRVADCVPVLLAGDGVVGAVHAGRKGLANQVSLRAVETMRELGAETVRAWIGPRACGGCYEVPEELRAEVAAIAPAAYATTRWQTPALDIGAGLVEQLTGDGVAVTDLAAEREACTIEGEDAYFSYRRQGQRSGRLGGLIGLRS